MSDLMEYKCPNCSGAISFDSASQSLKCPYCDTEFNIDTLKGYDDDLKDVEDKEIEWDAYDENSGNGDWKEGETDGMVNYVCNSCAGEIIADDTVAGTNCPYCGNPVIMKEKLSGTFRPDYVVPFKLDKKVAKEGLQGFMSGKPLLPKYFAQENHVDEMKQVYVPFWLFDCDTDAKIRYKATKVKAWSDSNYNYTKTDYYSVVRHGDMDFEKVPVDGSTVMDDAYMEAIEPFDYFEMKDFNTAYLAGILTNKYDVDANQSIARANERIKNSVESIFADTVHGYSSCRVETSNIHLEKGDISYALLPVWMLSSTYKGKVYTFAMNGQTGKFVGKLPVDKGRAAAYFGVIAAGLAAIFSVASIFIF